MSYFIHHRSRNWLRAAIACCSLAAFDDLAIVRSAPPLTPIAAFRTSALRQPPRGEALPRPVAPVEENVVAAGPHEPPPQPPLSALSIDIRPIGEVPQNTAAVDHYLAAPDINPTARGWDETLYFWQASNMAYRPLYFQQAYVERYGYNYGCLQPIVSGAQFFGTVPLVPFKAIVRHPNECVYTLGYDRPGNQGVSCPRW